MNEDTTRHCRRCAQVKPLTDFWRDKRGPGGRRTTCGACSQRARHTPPPINPPTLQPVVAPADLFTTPQLVGARCRGKWALFDPADGDDAPQVVERLHTEAIALCHRCPALAACRSWIESLPAPKRPGGVVAGRLIPEKSRGIRDDLAKPTPAVTPSPTLSSHKHPQLKGGNRA